MIDALVHRGPDDAGIHVDERGTIALGARRLSIIDVAGGHQPVANEDGSVWAVHNGEIYNFRALRRRLEAEGHRFASHCDSEVLVHLYERYGAALVHALEGMFAFAIWDAPRRRLLLARDRCGEKPLFVRRSGEAIEFASELGALLAVAPSSSRLDPAAIARFYVLGYVPPSQSIVEGIWQLPPGGVLEWRPGGEVEQTRYWRPPAPAERVDSRKPSELAAEAEELLGHAVRSRLVADVPLGLFLSGGLDSTLVTAITREVRDVRTFSVGYDIGEVSETSAAAAVAERLGAAHTELTLRSAEIEALTLRALGEIDQPLADRSLVPTFALCARARRDVKVIVGGEGADEYFAGYPRYRWLDRAQRLRRRAPAALPALAAAAGAWPDRARRARLATLASALPTDDQNLAWVSEGRAALAPWLYGERLRDRGSADGTAAAALMASVEGAGAAARALDFDRSHWLSGDVLTKADRAGMLNSLEVRTPFLERSLIEFACSVPFEVHGAGDGKALLRRVFERRVPGATAPSKRGFGTPVADWLRGPLASYLEHCAAAESRAISDGWFDASAVRTLVREHRAGGDRALALWPILALNAWLEGPHGSHVA